MQALKEVHAGDGIILEAGNYQARSCLKLPSGIRLVGNGQVTLTPYRSLKGETKAMREWQEIQPKLKALADIGLDDARRWLDYCTWAAGNRPHR